MVRGHNGVDKRIYLGKQSRNSVSPVKQRGKFDSFYQKRAFNFTRNNLYVIVFKVPNALTSLEKTDAVSVKSWKLFSNVAALIATLYAHQF